ncbi:TIR domain-containing protein [Limoniibacter endophyticus]|uniref:Molecular chaperone Tir n=1 Tax=Limoniibacter endophyticus TaxID=1565040 RepID=A0A8J3DQ43_9HYPH|nr:TIR domain-containing protein [Limoniibacter endophyticus]GHC70954.1 molecular chaperone Tir [Limoniibacter endophyticus]
MGYRNKTYVIFDADSDMWAYGYMKGWNKNKNIEFNFHDAHDLNTITNASSEENTKRKLRERFSSAKQAVVLIGESTKNLYRFVRWEIEVCQRLGLPIVAVNLNKMRRYDADLCPPILRDADAVHVSFNARIIKYALDDFCANYSKYQGKGDNWHYKDQVYKDLGL